MNLTVSMYIVPPLLSLFASLWLAVASALRRGWPGHQNLQLATLFLFLALLPSAFICHHLIPDEATLLTIERSIHFFYVFTPLVYLVTTSSGTSVIVFNTGRKAKNKTALGRINSETAARP